MKDLGEHLPDTALIVGCGDVGRRVALRLRAIRGVNEIRGIVRSNQSAGELRAAGIAAQLHDLDGGAALALDAPLVFWFAPPPGSGTLDPRLRRCLTAQARAPERLVYISTSGVYGDCQGRWIDEDEPPKPVTDRARRRLDAELALREYAAQSGSAIVILRVPGIYGPGRLPVERLRKRLPVLREDQSPWSNRIHADDLAEAALHAAAFGRAGRSYNVSDGAPTTMTDYFQRCARALGLPEPPQLPLEEACAALTPAMWSFMEESKRLSTKRLTEDLHFTPRYRDLDAGLRACLPK